MMTFTKKQLAALRRIAQRATQGEWVAFISPGTDTYAVHTPGDERYGDIIKWPGFDCQKNAKNNAKFIAAFNPEIVLALLDVLDASLPDGTPAARPCLKESDMATNKTLEAANLWQIERAKFEKEHPDLSVLLHRVEEQLHSNILASVIMLNDISYTIREAERKAKAEASAPDKKGGA